MFASVFWGSSIFSIKCFCLEAKQAQRYGSSTSVYYCKFNQFSGQGVYDVHSSNSWQQQNWPSFPLKPCSIILRSKELNPLSTVQKLCNLEQSQQHFLLPCIRGTHAGGLPCFVQCFTYNTEELHMATLIGIKWSRTPEARYRFSVS